MFTNMFTRTRDLDQDLIIIKKDLVEALETVKNLKSEHAKHAIRQLEIESEHKIALKEKEFEMKHFKDDEMKMMHGELAQYRQDIAVLKKENELLVKITDLNSDVIDVKDLMNSLIKKLPEINLQNLTVNSNGTK